MSNEPTKGKFQPVLVELVAGETYWWCRCGKSQAQPFCDGSHKGTDFGPKKVEIKEVRTLAWCGCKHSKNGAMCDGSHAGLV